MRLRAVKYGILQIDSWTLSSSQTWCVLGRNASGKSSLCSILCGDYAFEGTIEDMPKKRPAVASLEALQKEHERELANDDSDFLDQIDNGSTGLEILLESGTSEDEARATAAQFHVEELLESGCRRFSSGETRRIYLLREILKKPDLLILDEPFEGLDREGRETCSKLVEKLITTGTQILLLSNRIADVADWVTHIALLENGKLLLAGARDSILRTPECSRLLESHRTTPPIPDLLDTDANPTPDPLVRMTQCSVTYDGIPQFQNFNWTLRPGQHTLITGTNGSGKSTLLNLITGDHPQCYANDLQVLGYQRGSGESIWDIKRQLGILSPTLHRDYRAGGSTQSVALSGFFDSIGLYEQPNAKQIRIANQWLTLFGMHALIAVPFHSLSYGQQRLALIARALVKQPPLLILDEPTQGLDDANRRIVLACLERLAGLERTTLLFVSHRADERLPLFKNRLSFRPDPSKSARYKIF